MSMAKKDQRRPEPPLYRDGDYATRYNNISSFRTVVLDEGAFLYTWEILHRHWKNNIEKTYIGPELRAVIERMELAFEEQAPDFMPEDTEIRKKGAAVKGKRQRCPDCNTKGPKKVLKQGRPMWKCEDCGRRWPREAPEPSVEPSKPSSEVQEATTPEERPRKRKKPAKKKVKK